MRNIPPLTAIRAFEAAARHANFTRAADELGMTQAAVSYQMKLLEDRLGTALFYRSKGRVTLTETGARIAPLVSGAFDTLDDAFNVARSEAESVLTISCFNSFAANWLALRLGGFQMKLPHLAVRLHTEDRIVDFARDEVDVAIRTTDKAVQGLVAHFLMGTAVVPLASPDFLARHPPIRTPADVMRAPRLSPGDSWWNRWFETAGGGTSVAPVNPGVRLDSQVMEGNAAIAGQGIAILNGALWQHEIRAGRLVQPHPAVAFGRYRYWLVYPEYKRNTPKVRAFRDWMLAEIARDAALDTYGVYLPPDDAQR